MPHDEPLVDAFVHQMQKDYVKHSKEDKGAAESDTNHSIQRKVEHAEVKVNSGSYFNIHKAESASLKGEDGIIKVSKKNPKRHKVGPSLIGLKKIARLLEADKNALIRSLKKSKSSRRKIVKGKSSKTSSKTFLARKMRFHCRRDQVLQVNLKIGRIGL